MISTILFDFDMTLVDSSYGITDCMNLVAQKVGLRQVTRDEVLSIIGMPMEKGWLKLWGRYDNSWARKFRQTFTEREFAGIFPFENTVDTLVELRSRGLSLGIATNRQEGPPVVKAVGLYRHFDAVLGLESVENPKPAPDLVLKAMEMLGARSENTLYVGDTDIDMKTAVSAEVRGVGMTTGKFHDDELTRAGAWKTLPDISGLLALV